MRIPCHPGEILKDELEVRSLSANKFAKAIGVPQNRISDILRGRRNVTAETALRLAAYFGNSAKFWLNLQTQHDLGKAKSEHGAAITREVKAA